MNTGAARATVAVALARSEAHVIAATQKAVRDSLAEVARTVTPAVTASGKGDGSFDSSALARIPPIWLAAVNADVLPALEAVFRTAGRRLIMAGEPIPGTWEVSDAAVADYMGLAANRMRGIANEMFAQARLALKAGLQAGDAPAALAQRVIAALAWDGPTAAVQARLDAAKAARDAALAKTAPYVGLRAANLPPAQAKAVTAARANLADARGELAKAYSAAETAGKPYQVRAMLTARTESTRAYNTGQLVGASTRAQATGETLLKTWLATDDARTREDHADADGQQVSLDDSFDVGGYQMLHPGDPSAPASEVCDCRCAMLIDRAGE